MWIKDIPKRKKSSWKNRFKGTINKAGSILRAGLIKQNIMPGIKSKINDEELIRLYDSGLSPEAIGKIIGFSRCAVRKALKRNNHVTRGNTINSVNKFWAQVFKSTEAGGCWIWTGSHNNKGYGEYSYLGKKHMSHRLAYELVIGKIPNGLHLCHKCDNPKCCNPDHLIPGTRQFNMIDCLLKNRNPNAKLNVEKVKLIKEMNRKGYSIKYITDQFDISRRTIREIINNKRWKHVI